MMTTTTSDVGAVPPDFIGACEGDVGSRIEAHCMCIQQAIAGKVDPLTIQHALGDIRAGDPPAWFMAAAINCPS